MSHTIQSLEQWYAFVVPVLGHGEARLPGLPGPCWPGQPYWHGFNGDPVSKKKKKVQYDQGGQLLSSYVSAYTQVHICGCMSHTDTSHTREVCRLKHGHILACRTSGSHQLTYRTSFNRSWDLGRGCAGRNLYSGIWIQRT